VLDLVSGYLEPLSGRVILGGTDVTGLPPELRAARGLGRSFQDARLFATLTVREAIATAFERHVPVPDAMAAFVLSPAVKVSEREIERRVASLVDDMGLQAFADKFVGELSTGTRRIVDLACVLAHDPSVLLLDEPFTALDDKAIAVLQRLLREGLAAGKTIVMSTHQLREALELASHVALLVRGKVAFHGPRTPEMVSDPGWVYARYGEG
jgi:ABC-type branched-subunit amino acid transport system ATPase component